MSNDSISYRAIEKKDYKQIAKVICDTWHYEKITSHYSAIHLSYAFLFSSLIHQTYTQVAVRNHVPVGIVMGRTNDVPLKNKVFYLNLAFHLVFLLFTSQGKQAFQSYRRHSQITSALLKQTYESYDGELILFAVDQSTRGTGVGSHLFNAYLQHLRNQGARTFYLFTDTSCTYTFYEHKGLRRIGALTRRMPFLQKEISFFLYKGDLQQSELSFE